MDGSKHGLDDVDQAFELLTTDELPAVCCRANLDRTGSSANAIDFNDLSILLGFWGPCFNCPSQGPACCVANLDQTGSSANAIDFNDLSILLGGWGACPGCPTCN